jgi:hypothetical protein
MGRLLAVPTFEFEPDRTVQTLLRGQLPDLAVVGLDCQDLAAEGALFNYMTWQVSGAWSFGVRSTYAGSSLSDLGEIELCPPLT